MILSPIFGFLFLTEKRRTRAKENRGRGLTFGTLEDRFSVNRTKNINWKLEMGIKPKYEETLATRDEFESKDKELKRNAAQFVNIIPHGAE